MIIDSNALIHRAFHALPPLKTKKGEIVNAVYGFCLTLFKALNDLKPDFVAACFDVKGPTLRQQISNTYKAQRKKAPDELYAQIEGVKRVLKALNIPLFGKQGFEADDLIATLVKKARKHEDLEVVILTGDNDALTLVDEKTKVYFLRKGVKDIVLFGEKEVKEKYQGLVPRQLVDFRALRGDPSDNIPGVKGIGEKTAIQLLKDFKTLESIYQASDIKTSILEKLKRDKEQAFVSKALAMPHFDNALHFSLKELKFGDFKQEEIKETLERFEFFALLSKIPFHQEEAPPLFKEGNQTLQEIERLEEQGVFSKKVALLEKDLVPVIALMEKNGIKVDLGLLKKFSQFLEEKLKRLEKQIYQKAKGNFNINSTQQLSEILFEKLRIPTEKVKKTPKGALSTNAQELEKLKKEHPIIELIIEYRELFKLKTSFADPLPLMVNSKTGRIHPKFHQLGTETGRLSCSDPNLQNVPARGELGVEIRKCFIAEKGFVFISADYSQIELRMAAHLSGDKKMISAFKHDQDIHSLTASEIFGKKDIAKEERSLAKTLNFGVLYGMGPVSFSLQSGLSRKEAKDFIEKYFANFPELKSFIENQKEKARTEGFTETILGRKRFFPEIDSRDQRLRAQAERMAANLPLQGSVADMMKMAMLKISEKVLNKSCQLILQIHDELLFEVKEERAEATAKKIKDVMEHIVNFEFPLTVEVKIGENWANLKKI